LTPDAWDELTEKDRAQMIAYEDVSATMAAYEDQLSEDKIDNNRHKGKARK